MDENISISELEALARRVRGDCVLMSHRAKAAHLGSALSCVDILVALYFSALRIEPANPGKPGRDRCILSKGHAVAALYSVLARRGYFPLEKLDTFAMPGSKLGEHPIPWSVAGLEAATGSLGHGLPIGVGMALAGRIQGNDYRVFAVLSDGECNEGSVWESAMFAPAHDLDNVVAIIDFNKWQATGRSCDVMALCPLADKWRAFGWNAVEVDGHDMKALVEALSKVPDNSGKPLAIVAHTVKGRGVSFMEDDNNWHYRIPKEDEVRAAFKELGLE